MNNPIYEASRPAFEANYKPEDRWILLRSGDDWMYPETRSAWYWWCRALDHASSRECTWEQDFADWNTQCEASYGPEFTICIYCPNCGYKVKIQPTNEH